MSQTTAQLPRVASLVPSGTETLCFIGGRGLLVARSHACDFPAPLGDVPVVTSQALRRGQLPPGADPRPLATIDRAVVELWSGGRPLFALEAPGLIAARPGVVLTQPLASGRWIDPVALHAAADAIAPRPQVLELAPRGVEDMLDDVLRVGQVVGLEASARAGVVALRERFARAEDHANPYVDGPRVVVLEWTDPLVVAGHWTAQLVERAGGRHVLNPTAPVPGSGMAVGPQQAQRLAGRSIRVTPEQIVQAAPDAVIVAPCGLSLAPARFAAQALAREPWFAQIPAVRAGRVAVVDANSMLSRPSPRLAEAFEWLVGWLNDRPDLIPPGFPWARLAG